MAVFEVRATPSGYTISRGGVTETFRKATTARARVRQLRGEWAPLGPVVFKSYSEDGSLEQVMEYTLVDGRIVGKPKAKSKSAPKAKTKSKAKSKSKSKSASKAPTSGTKKAKSGRKAGAYALFVKRMFAEGKAQNIKQAAALWRARGSKSTSGSTAVAKPASAPKPKSASKPKRTRRAKKASSAKPKRGGLTPRAAESYTQWTARAIRIGGMTLQQAAAAWRARPGAAAAATKPKSASKKKRGRKAKTKSAYKKASAAAKPKSASKKPVKRGARKAKATPALPSPTAVQHAAMRRKTKHVGAKRTTAKRRK